MVQPLFEQAGILVDFVETTHVSQAALLARLHVLESLSRWRDLAWQAGHASEVARAADLHHLNGQLILIPKL